MCNETSSPFPVGRHTEMLPSPLSAGLLLPSRFPALWEALPGASGVSQPEIHPCSKQALTVSSWELLGAAFLCLLCCKHSAQEPWKLLFTLAGASKGFRLGSYWCFGMSSMSLSIPLAFALAWFHLLFSCIGALNDPSVGISLSSHITLKHKQIIVAKSV